MLSRILAWLLPLPLAAEETQDSLARLRGETDLLWVVIAAVLVFFMQAGFAYVEAGFTRAKNAVNILMKNITDFTVGSLAFYLIGFALMFGEQLLPQFGIGKPMLASALLGDAAGKPDAARHGFFLFQMVFAGTAATIASGAMAERTRFHAYVIYSALASGLVYPIFGSLAWANLLNSENAGFLSRLGFVDFAGSTVVHSVGGWIGLAGAIVLGPRLGKYARDSVQPILGHNLSMSVLGMFILWFGWFGFNPGSTGNVKDGSFAIVAVMTNMAAVAGGVSATFLSWLLYRRPDISIVVNGILGGLVAITAPCYNVDAGGAIAIGLVAGVLVIAGVVMLDRLRIDDPVGAVSVHGLCGAWGTLAVALFANPNYGDGRAGLFYGGSLQFLSVQALGVGMAFLWSFLVALLIFYLLKITIGLRASENEEVEGLDIIEHGSQAYSDEIL